jgi:hypothetical protein
MGDVLLDLLLEVEALRRTLLSLNAGDPDGVRKAYGEAYLSAALLSHNGAGFCDGWEKLLWLFYPEDELGGETPGRGRVWRARLMLERLLRPGDERREKIKRFIKEAEEAECCS